MRLNIDVQSMKTVAEPNELTEARRVLDLEIKGLSALSNSLGPDFIAAVELLSSARGRVIVTGMGKSGHIAAKIAATMASIGTPAQFVHPAEASHGDLGMIVVGDIMLALSNSGETPELAAPIDHVRRLSIPLIAITGCEKSTLDKMADVSLVLPPITEACSFGLAPTTSTTVMLALGDAISMTLLRRLDFSINDFQHLHPGGRLGIRLLKVADLMHSGDEMPLVDPNMPMSEALIEMTAKRFGCLGVINTQGKLLGIITDGDLRRHMDTDLINKKTADIMTTNPMTLTPDTLVDQAMTTMNKNNITNLFVVVEDKPVGILHIHDCLRANIA